MSVERPKVSRSIAPTEPNGGLTAKECIKLKAAAEYLECSQGTLENWISARKFTAADGLRKVGGLTRIHFPTLRTRFIEGTLMKAG